MLELAVVMPVYNEDECIVKVLNAWVSELRTFKIPFKIFVIDDKSTDRTGSLLKSLQIVHNPHIEVLTNLQNLGHGGSILRGYNAVVGLSNWIFQVDSDDQFQPGDFTKFWHKRNQYDFLVGRRGHRDDPPVRLLVTRILRMFSLLFMRELLPDANCPYRLMHSRVLRALLLDLANLLPEPPFAPNILLTYLAKITGYNVGFIPITHKARTSGVVSIRKWKLFRVCLQTAKEIVNLRIQLFRS